MYRNRSKCTIVLWKKAGTIRYDLSIWSVIRAFSLPPADR